MTRRARFCNRRGNLSFTSINLPRIAIESHGDIDLFFKTLDERMELVFEQLDERFEIQARKKVRNYPFLMGEHVWMDSEKLGWDDEVREVLKHGTAVRRLYRAGGNAGGAHRRAPRSERTRPSSWA